MPYDLSKLCIHTQTTRPWSLEEALNHYAQSGVGGISVWQEAVTPMGSVRAGELIRQFPLEVVSYVRGGFFPALEEENRWKAIERTKKMLDEAAAIGAPMLVLVCGAEPRQPPALSRKQVRDGIEAILPYAMANGVKLAIEPLHPMYADLRSVINTLEQANDLAESFHSEWVGVVVDVYHVWWDPKLEAQIVRCGQNGNLFAFHICDWKYPLENMLTDRGLMGEGCIPIQEIAGWVKQAGFSGFHEVEIFSTRFWEMPQEVFLKRVVDAYLDLGRGGV